MSRELVILVADGTMRAVFTAFFERQFHHALMCAPFEFNPRLDLFNNPLEKDGGVHLRCHEILRSYLNTHRRALVVLDQQFGGERPAEEVRVEIEQRLNTNGWAGRAAAAVIEPELEVLLWQDNVNVERALRHQGGSLRRLLATDGRWPEGAPKPLAPKDVIQTLIRTNRAGVPMVVYSQIAMAVSTAGCVDPAFHRVRDALRAWFPAEGT
ncbi:hypothetical protein [uncultured Methylibium sp.]|uniref:methylation-associated defense system protein MAD4 n=1 Tax=uncultured Methylibium sp. TaxID=381093 RepID=UPI0025CDC0B2|nr:hypothetical protein [uncultured Methylibium sp.]